MDWSKRICNRQTCTELSPRIIQIHVVYRTPSKRTTELTPVQCEKHLSVLRDKPSFSSAGGPLLSSGYTSKNVAPRRDTNAATRSRDAREFAAYSSRPRVAVPRRPETEGLSIHFLRGRIATNTCRKRSIEELARYNIEIGNGNYARKNRKEASVGVKMEQIHVENASLSGLICGN
jgi:hypothetical protein